MYAYSRYKYETNLLHIWEIKRQSEKERESERQRDRESEQVCGPMCVRESEREKDRD